MAAADCELGAAALPGQVRLVVTPLAKSMRTLVKSILLRQRP